MSALLGEVGRYTLYERIAEGGMAEVFLAEQNSEAGVRKLVALKRMLPHLGRQERFVAMFLDEARLAARLMHQNIAQVLDFGVDGDRYFLVMEYVTGESLLDVIRTTARKGQHVPLDVALTLMSQACDGLHYAHTLDDHGVPLNIVHRDVTPSNVLVTAQGSVKIIDFGIARAANRLQDLTTEGVFKGKVAYASPEQLMGHPLDARSDVFSLGVLLYELTTSERLFRRDTEMASMHAVLNDPIPSVTRGRPDLPVALDAVLARALARAPKDRYATALELRKALEALMPPRPQRVDDWLEQLLGRRLREPTLPPRSSPSMATLPDRALARDASQTTQPEGVPTETPAPTTLPRRTRGLPVGVGVGLVLVGLAGWWSLRAPPEAPAATPSVEAPAPAPQVKQAEGPAAPQPSALPEPAPDVKQAEAAPSVPPERTPDVKQAEVPPSAPTEPALGEVAPPQPEVVPPTTEAKQAPAPKPAKPTRGKSKTRPKSPTENPLTL